MTNGQFRPTGFRILPPVVKNLLIINGLFFLATFAFGSAFRIDITEYLGLRYWGAEKFSPFQLVTYMFLHSPEDFAHIFFNMFALWMFGNTLENVWGPKRFLTYYIFTGIGAALFHYLVFYIQVSPVIDTIDTFLSNPSNKDFINLLNTGEIKAVTRDMLPAFQSIIPKYNLLLNSNPTEALQLATDFMNQYRIDFLNAPNVIGASGAVFGLLLAFGMMFPNALIYVYFAIPIKAKWFVIVYGAVELYLGFANNAGDNVAHFAHLGGMIFGFFLIKYWKRN